MSNKINVSESFYSLQCEGPSTGMPAVFLRMQGCDFDCVWCDTTEVWLHGTAYTYEELYRIWLQNGFIDRLNEGAHLIITGGNPLLRQSEILGFLHYCYDQDIVKATQLRNFVNGDDADKPWFIEVETQGNMIPNAMFDEHISQYNVSPKLANSKMRAELRIKPDVIRWHCTQRQNNFSVFKFVVANDEDVDEMFTDYINKLEIPKSLVFLMPCADTREKLVEIEPKIMEICKTLNLKYTTRLHIHAWNKKTGV